ncbi:hypothetical protein M3558_24885, partial [Brevibacillus invocatus]|nr:hypothetical protein [Brevibacillus invocatus]MCM3432587.1 hypothetical protein [Brevibacillus invocatus]
MQLIEEFEQSLVENGIAPKTIESYVGDVRAFCAFENGCSVLSGNNQSTDFPMNNGDFLLLRQTGSPFFISVRGNN